MSQHLIHMKITVLLSCRTYISGETFLSHFNDFNDYSMRFQPQTLVTAFIDQSHNENNWCIMADFKLLIAVMHQKLDGCGSNFARP